MTIDDVYAQNVIILANIATLQSKVNTIDTNVVATQSKVNTMDAKIDILSGDTTSTNVLDKVLTMDRRVRAIEFKILKIKG